jgi:hypothetical protein
MHILDHRDLVERFVKTARALCEFIQENIGEPGHGTVASVVDLFLRDHGGDPGTAMKPAPARAATNTVGSLFAGLPDDQVRLTLGNASEIAQRGFAPAIIALLGPAAKPDTIAGIWPLLMHLAPYLDAALLDAAEEGGRA